MWCAIDFKFDLNFVLFILTRNTLEIFALKIIIRFSHFFQISIPLLHQSRSPQQHSWRHEGKYHSKSEIYFYPHHALCLLWWCYLSNWPRRSDTGNSLQGGSDALQYPYEHTVCSPESPTENPTIHQSQSRTCSRYQSCHVTRQCEHHYRPWHQMWRSNGLWCQCPNQWDNDRYNHSLCSVLLLNLKCKQILITISIL